MGHEIDDFRVGERWPPFYNEEEYEQGVLEHRYHFRSEWSHYYNNKAIHYKLDTALQKKKKQEIRQQGDRRNTDPTEISKAYEIWVTKLLG